jgi:transposase
MWREKRRKCKRTLAQEVDANCGPEVGIHSDGSKGKVAVTRAVLNGILWVLGTGAQWRELHNKYPPYQTCHRRFQQWVRQGKLEGILHARGKLELEEAFIDDSFTGAKKGPRGRAQQARQRDENHTLSPMITVPLAVSIESASPHESELVDSVLEHSFLDTLPARLIGDKAYDSDR